MNVKRILRWTMALVCLLPIFSVMAQDTTSTAEPMATMEAMSTMEAMTLPDLGGRTITVAIENAYQPFNFIDEETGEAIGWDYDVMREICVRLNCVPEFIETSWDGMILAVSGGEYDMAMDGISITEERMQQVDFSIPYITTIQRLMLRLDDDRFATAADFIADPNARIAVQTATTNYELAVDLVGEDRIDGFDSFGASIQSLIAGDADAVIIDDVAGQGYVGTNAESIKLLPDELSSDPLGFIYPKGSDLREPIDMALQSMMADETLGRFSWTWGLGPSVDSIAEIVVMMASDEEAPEFTTLLAAVQAAGLTDALMDESASFTVFAPTDAAFAALPEGALDALLADPALLTRVLTYHVLPMSVMAADVTPMDATTLESGTLAVSVTDEGGVMINDANVVQADVTATNGVIHVIDKVLLPADVAEMLAQP